MMLGRLTLNPIKHIDPVGTLLVPGILLLFSPFIFGWAKPVPVTWENLKHPKRDMALVALAGPGSNLLMAILWACVIKATAAFGAEWGVVAEFIIYVGIAGITINLILMVLNMLPIPPLDGGRVLSGLLPGPWSWQLNRLEPYGFPLLLVLMFTGLLGQILTPLLRNAEAALTFLVGI